VKKPFGASAQRTHRPQIVTQLAKALSAAEPSVTAGNDRGGHVRYDVCGVPISALRMDEAAKLIVSAALREEPLQVHLCNAYTLSLVDGDPELRAALTSAELNLPDGTPVAWLGRSRGVTDPVRGPSLVAAVACAGAPAGVRHYLYGGAVGVADLMRQRLAQTVPGIQIVGVEAPDYHDLDDQEFSELCKRIRQSKSMLVWVGLGTPRQDYLVPRLAQALHLPVVPVGAAFDFWSGRVPEAPCFLQGSGVEWVYRFVHEPRRLWRRYVFGNIRFVRAVIRHSRGS